MNMANARTILAILFAALLGIAFGALVLGQVHRPKVKHALPPSPAIVAPVAEDQPVRLAVASSYPTSAPQFGTLASRFGNNVIRASGGSIDVAVAEPAALVSPDNALEAVASGDLDALWGSPALWSDRDPALALFGAVPFGPRAGEFLSWMYYGGGRDLQDDLFSQMNIIAMPCGLAAPEAGGWFRNEIRRPEDFKGLSIRFSGLGAQVVARLGADVKTIAAGDIYFEMEQGNIDATEYSQPALDLQLGLYRLMKNYYFPGWHQQTILINLLVSKPKWESLSETQKAILELACGENIRAGLAEGESLQLPALQEMRRQGVEVRKFPAPVLSALESAWQEVAAEIAAKNPGFRKTWDSYNEFRKSYAEWRKLTFVD
jgi:TRAP-type mannitol/chloroaromatic compound transport system substrate-binding protein